MGEESAETFMCAAMGTRKDPSEELELAVRLMNETVEGIDGVRFGVHVCRGNWSRREDVLLSGNYGPMLPYLTQMDVDQLVLEFATPRAGELEVFKEYRNEKEIGLGVVNPRTDEVESPDQIVERVREALRYFEPEKVFLNPDCGFGTFAERNVNTPDSGLPEASVDSRGRADAEAGVWIGGPGGALACKTRVSHDSRRSKRGGHNHGRSSRAGA